MIERTSGPHWLFDATATGFETSDTTAGRCAFAFSHAGAYNDWQPSRVRVADHIPGGNRVLRQDLGAGPLALATGLMFRDAVAYQRFLANRHLPGTLRMRADRTVYAPDRYVDIHGTTYAEFDAVTVASDPSDVRQDSRGVVHCAVVFEREEAEA